VSSNSIEVSWCSRLKFQFAEPRPEIGPGMDAAEKAELDQVMGARKRIPKPFRSALCQGPRSKVF